MTDSGGDAPSTSQHLSPSPFLTFAEDLDLLETRGLRRHLRLIESTQNAYVLRNGRELCCLCSNNYLGLANHPKVIEAVAQAVKQWGWGAGASRLVSGHMTPHQQLEERIAVVKAQKKQMEASLATPEIYSNAKKFSETEKSLQLISEELDKLDQQYEEIFDQIVNLESNLSS